jgi:hypothetical protein
MSERLQLNLRLDKYLEMPQIIHSKAKEEGSSMNEFCVNLLRQGLGLDVDKTPVAEALARISALERRFEEMESNLLGEVRT